MGFVFRDWIPLSPDQEHTLFSALADLSCLRRRQGRMEFSVALSEEKVNDKAGSSKSTHLNETQCLVNGLAPVYRMPRHENTNTSRNSYHEQRCAVRLPPGHATPPSGCTSWEPGLAGVAWTVALPLPKVPPSLCSPATAKAHETGKRAGRGVGSRDSRQMRLRAFHP